MNAEDIKALIAEALARAHSMKKDRFLQDEADCMVRLATALQAQAGELERERTTAPRVEALPTVWRLEALGGGNGWQAKGARRAWNKAADHLERALTQDGEKG